VALLRKMTCNLRHPMSLRHPVATNVNILGAFQMEILNTLTHAHTLLLSPPRPPFPPLSLSRALSPSSVYLSLSLSLSRTRARTRSLSHIHESPTYSDQFHHPGIFSGRDSQKSPIFTHQRALYSHLIHTQKSPTFTHKSALYSHTKEP